MRTRNRWLEMVYGVKFGDDCSVSLSSRFALRRRGDIVVGSETLIAFRTLLLAYDPRTKTPKPIRVGSRCFIGGGSTILAGVTIGDECIVGGGSVVTEDVPPRSIVVGNPARVLRSDIQVGRFGRLEGADDNEERLYRL